MDLITKNIKQNLNSNNKDISINNCSDNNYIHINNEKGKNYNWGNATFHLEKKIKKEIAKNLRIKEKDLKEKEQKEQEQSNFVSDYANYNSKTQIKPLTENPLYNKNMFVNKKKPPNRSK